MLLRYPAAGVFQLTNGAPGSTIHGYLRSASAVSGTAYFFYFPATEAVSVSRLLPVSHGMAVRCVSVFWRLCFIFKAIARRLKQINIVRKNLNPLRFRYFQIIDRLSANEVPVSRILSGGFYTPLFIPNIYYVK